jgi:pSer/pThr/pTyr-binding forkhead associated (FHA) protein
MFYKLIMQGDVDGFHGRSWTFSPPAILGRDPSSAVCIEHRSISRQHCQFSLNGEGSLLVRDLNSMNGIYLDDVRVQQTILRPHQIIQIGAIQLQIEESTEDEQQQGAMPHLQPKGNVDRTQAMKALRFELKRE